MNRHYTPEQLELYRHGEMSVLGRIQCAAHLKECADCRKKLDDLKSDDALVNELRESVRVYKELSKTPVSPASRK